MISNNALAHLAVCWAGAMGRACWQGGLAILLAWFLCRLFPRIPPSCQCWLWRLVYLKLFVALLWATPLNLPLMPPNPAAPSFAASPDLAPLEPMITISPISPSRSPQTGPFPIASLSLFGLWLLGCGWRLLQIRREGHNIRRIRSTSQTIDDPYLVQDCHALCLRLGLRQQPQLLWSQGDYPLLVGPLRPAILLPQRLGTDCTAPQNRLILAHELAHLKRRDLLWAWIPSLGRCLFFFHPLVWLAEREWQQSQEMACDEQVLQLSETSRSEYGTVLLKVALQSHTAFPTGLATLGVAESYATVRRRLLAMKHVGKMSRRNLIAAGTLLAALGITGIIPWTVTAQDKPAGKAQPGRNTHSNQDSGPVAMWIVERLELNSTQQEHVKEIHENSVRQVRQSLTPAQLKILDGNGEGNNLSFLGLTDAQKTQIEALTADVEQQRRTLQQNSPSLEHATEPQRRAYEEAVRAIEQSAKARFMQILTPEQRELALKHSRQAEPENPLNLTPEQRESLKRLEQEVRQQREAVERDDSLSHQEKERRMGAIMETATSRSQEILTPEQRQIQEQQNQERRADPYSLSHLQHLLNLTNAQKSRIQAIYQASERQFQQMLTPAQKKRLAELRNKRTEGA